MKLKSTTLLQAFGLLLFIVVLVIPSILFIFSPERIANAETQAPQIWDVLIRTLVWSIGIGLCSTVIGWLVGIRIASLSPSTFSGIIILLLMSLALPAYAIFYAWWQAWPSGTWLHAYVVKHDLLTFAMQTCVFIALVGWSWPIPALISSMSNRTTQGILLLHQLDEVRIWRRFANHWATEKKLILSSFIIVVAWTSTNTTSFDLAQVGTIGNELRAVLASTGSLTSVPILIGVGFVMAAFASICILRFKATSKIHAIQLRKTSWPVILIWSLLIGFPLMMSAVMSIGPESIQLWAQYKYDVLLSLYIAISVALVACLIVIVSMSMHLSTSKTVHGLALLIDFGWLMFACLPASFIALLFSEASIFLHADLFLKTPLTLIVAQIATIGFVGSLAGRWVASCSRVKVLNILDAPQSAVGLCKANSPRLVMAMCVTFAVSIAMSFGEIPLSTQLSAPSANQPISVALLHAMHYQRPEIVTTALVVLVGIAIMGGLFTTFVQRRVLVLFCFVCILVGCNSDVPTPISNTRSIGKAGTIDSHFVTPRAIAANDQKILVIDKSGRLQLFGPKGTFESSIELELSGTGFPTGVSIDSDGNIWIADTHQHRILVINQDGETKLSFGEYGQDEGQFLYPTDIAFGLDNQVYVTEYGGNDRVSVFNHQGQFIRSFGSHGTGQHQFRRPQSIDVDPSNGNLFIADSGNHRIVVMSPEGKVLNIISSVGREPSNVLYPYGILIDSPKTILVCEYGNNRLQRFSKEGVSLGIWGHPGSELGFLRTPWGVAKTNSGIVIADTGNNRLQLLPDMMTSK